MQRNPYAVVEGLAIARHAVGAAKAYIGIKEAFDREAKALARAVMDFRRLACSRRCPSTWCGCPTLTVRRGDRAPRGRRGRPPLPRILRPFMQGLFADASSENPTLVNNVETLANACISM
jgi:NADH:ubiquinone oxidoreductase subunit F (NADH-binding)